MVLTKVSEDLTSIISETGATSNLAATLGSRFYKRGRQPQYSSQRCCLAFCSQQDFHKITSSKSFWFQLNIHNRILVHLVSRQKNKRVIKYRNTSYTSIICLLWFTFPKAEAPAQMWVKLNCFCVCRISGVNSSNKTNKSESAYFINT